MITKESLLFHGIESSSRSGGLLPVTRRNALLKAAFLLGNRGEKREIIAAIRGAAEIPPAVKWDAETIKDCVANYYFENNRYPRVFDLCLLNCLPTAEAIKYVFGVSAQRWLDGYRCFVVGFESEAASGQETGKRTKKNIALVTRKQALLAAESVLEGEEKERVREMIAEYPIAEWNERNVADVLISFYEKYGRVPAEREMKNSCELPYYGIFRYRFHTTYRAFLMDFLPPLYEIYCGGANERNNAEISGAVSGSVSGAVSGGAKKQGAKSAERKRKAETKKGEPKRGKTKSGKIKSIKIIRLDFGGSFFFPTCSNVQDYYFWEEEKKYKDTFILDYFLNKSARKDTCESLPDNAPDNAPDKAIKNAPVNDTDNAQGKAMKNAPGNEQGKAPGNERKVARHGKPVGSRFAAWDKSWEIAQKTARLTERENALKNTLKNTPQNALKNTPPTDSIHASADGRTGDPTGSVLAAPTGGRRNFRGNAR